MGQRIPKIQPLPQPTHYECLKCGRWCECKYAIDPMVDSGFEMPDPEYQDDDGGAWWCSRCLSSRLDEARECSQKLYE